MLMVFQIVFDNSLLFRWNFARLVNFQNEDD